MMFEVKEQVVKFRGKVVNHDPMTNPENGWVEGYYLQDLDNGVVKHYIFNCPCCWEVVPDTIGQFIRLHDKNGKEIYFGDIVRNMYGDIGSVIWFSDWSIRVDWGGGDIHFIDPDWGLEVIGNIHDNPNLLTNGRD